MVFCGHVCAGTHYGIAYRVGDYQAKSDAATCGWPYISSDRGTD